METLCDKQYQVLIKHFLNFRFVLETEEQRATENCDMQ